MKRALGLLIVLAIATLIGVGLHNGNGYALLRYGHTSVEMTLVTFVFFAVVAFLIVYVLVRIVLRLSRAPGGFGAGRRARRQRRANRDFLKGMIDVSEGRWDKGEREVVRSADGSDMALLNWLVAARAAQYQGADERRDHYLHRAYELSDDARMAVLLTQAGLQITHRQYELALATLRRIQELKPNHVHALRLLARLYKELGDYEQLHALIKSLRSHRALEADRIDEIELDAATMLMKTAADAGDGKRLDSIWHGLARHLRARPVATRPYARALIDADERDAAERFIRANVKADWDEELVRLYGLIPGGDTAARYAVAEGWLKQHDSNALLLLTLARLAIACELSGKARRFLEKSVQLGERAETYVELGRLLESLDEKAAATEAYKAALPLAMDAPRDTTSRPSLARL